MEKQEIKCPAGLKSIIEEVSRIMRKNFGVVSISLDATFITFYPYVVVWVYEKDEKKTTENGVKSFTFYPKTETLYSENEQKWKEMLEFIEKVKA